MNCYKGMCFCSQTCYNYECLRNTLRKDFRPGDQMVCYANFKNTCHGYKKDKEKMKKKRLNDKTIEILGTQLANAEAKHPVFCKSKEHAVTIITEELGELAQAVLDEESKERLLEEASHVAVSAIRFIEELVKDE